MAAPIDQTESASLHYLVHFGASTRIRDFISQVIELARNDPEPIGSSMIAWSPGVDFAMSSYLMGVVLPKREDSRLGSLLLRITVGPQINYRNAFLVGGLSMYRTLLPTSEFTPFQGNLGASLQLGFRTNYASSRGWYEPSPDRMDRFAAFHRANKKNQSQDEVASDQ